MWRTTGGRLLTRSRRCAMRTLRCWCPRLVSDNYLSSIRRTRGTVQTTPLVQSASEPPIFEVARDHAAVGGVFAAEALRDLPPEPPLDLASMRRLARRLHHRATRELLHPTSRPRSEEHT